VWHYAPDRHAIERRSVIDRDAWRLADAGDGTEAFFVGLTSIHWRESWKYGERAFRYCQHDLGHAIGALGLSAALCGWRAALLPGWSHHSVAALVGVDRDEDYVDAEREEPGCLMLVTRRDEKGSRPRPLFVDAVRQSRWFGRASQLSEEHVQWTFIDEVARATEDIGREGLEGREGQEGQEGLEGLDDRGLDARAIILQRRSAVALDGVSSTDCATFMRLMSRTLPGPGAPWDALWWSPRIHLALFVHRVDGLGPGLYVLARADPAIPRLRAAFRREFAWERVADGFPLWRLQGGDYRSVSRRLSCDQEIAADGFFSLGMIADFDAAIEAHGPSFYRQLFWESGVVGQVLYLEAEAAGARATGIGCFYDDPVHQLLGLSDHTFQSLYHFTVGTPVEDVRLTIEPGYSWETLRG
jgi:nitroreductase